MTYGDPQIVLKLKEEVIKKIEVAFSDVALGGGTTLEEAMVRDNRGTQREIDQARAKNIWWRWQDIPEEALVRCGSALSFCDDQGFIFHLPAFMRSAVRSFPNDCNSFYSACIFHTTQSPQDMIARYDLTPLQVRVIADFWRLDQDGFGFSFGKYEQKRTLLWVEASEKLGNNLGAWDLPIH